MVYLSTDDAHKMSEKLNYITFIDEMQALAGNPESLHLSKLKQTLQRASPELIPHLFWEQITSICNFYFHNNKDIRAIFKKAAEWEMQKQKLGI